MNHLSRKTHDGCGMTFEQEDVLVRAVAAVLLMGASVAAYILLG